MPLESAAQFSGKEDFGQRQRPVERGALSLRRIDHADGFGVGRLPVSRGVWNRCREATRQRQPVHSPVRAGKQRLKLAMDFMR